MNLCRTCKEWKRKQKELLTEAREVHLSDNDATNDAAPEAAWIVAIFTKELCNIQHAGSRRAGAGGRLSSGNSARAVQNYSLANIAEE